MVSSKGELYKQQGATSNSNSRVGHNVNLADTVGNTFYITGVQLEAASACTPYEHKDYTDSVRECQRYLYTTPYIRARCGMEPVHSLLHVTSQFQ